MIAALGTTVHGSSVVEITNDNFGPLVEDAGDAWLIEFYAPWCGHCRRLEPTYQAVAAKLAGQVRVGKVDGTQNTALMARFPVRGFPTIFSLRGGVVRELKGPRSEAALTNFALSDQGEHLSLFSSPLGPLGKLKGKIITISDLVIKLHSKVVKEYKLSPAVVWGLFSIAGLAGTASLVIFILYLFPQRNQPHLHQD